MVDPIKVKDDQILRFQRYLSGGRGFSFNARPLMPINDRYLELEVA